MAEKLIENPKVVAQLLAELVREQHQLNVTTIRVIAKHIHFVRLFKKRLFILYKLVYTPLLLVYRKWTILKTDHIYKNKGFKKLKN